MVRTGPPSSSPPWSSVRRRASCRCSRPPSIGRPLSSSLPPVPRAAATFLPGPWPLLLRPCWRRLGDCALLRALLRAAADARPAACAPLLPAEHVGRQFHVGLLRGRFVAPAVWGPLAPERSASPPACTGPADFWGFSPAAAGLGAAGYGRRDRAAVSHRAARADVVFPLHHARERAAATGGAPPERARVALRWWLEHRRSEASASAASTISAGAAADSCGSLGRRFFAAPAIRRAGPWKRERRSPASCARHSLGAFRLGRRSGLPLAAGAAACGERFARAWPLRRRQAGQRRAFPECQCNCADIDQLFAVELEFFRQRVDTNCQVQILRVVGSHTGRASGYCATPPNANELHNISKPLRASPVKGLPSATITRPPHVNIARSFNVARSLRDRNSRLGETRPHQRASRSDAAT